MEVDETFQDDPLEPEHVENFDETIEVDEPLQDEPVEPEAGQSFDEITLEDGETFQDDPVEFGDGQRRTDFAFKYNEALYEKCDNPQHNPARECFEADYPPLRLSCSAVTTYELEADGSFSSTQTRITATDTFYLLPERGGYDTFITHPNNTAVNALQRDDSGELPSRFTLPSAHDVKKLNLFHTLAVGASSSYSNAKVSSTNVKTVIIVCLKKSRRLRRN